MTHKEFLKKCLDILLQQEFIDGVPLFTSGYIDEYVVGDEEASMPLSEFLDELYDEIVDSLAERKE